VTAFLLFLFSVVFSLPAASFASGITFSGGTPSTIIGPQPAARITLREATGQISLGTVASPCLNAGTTASSASVTAGAWILFVLSETVSVCMAPDTNCDAGVLDLVPGTQLPIVVNSANAGTWYCRSAGGTGYVSLRKAD